MSAIHRHLLIADSGSSSCPRVSCRLFIVRFGRRFSGGLGSLRLRSRLRRARLRHSQPAARSLGDRGVRHRRPAGAARQPSPGRRRGCQRPVRPAERRKTAAVASLDVNFRHAAARKCGGAATRSGRSTAMRSAGGDKGRLRRCFYGRQPTVGARGRRSARRLERDDELGLAQRRQRPGSHIENCRQGLAAVGRARADCCVLPNARPK